MGRRGVGVWPAVAAIAICAAAFLMWWMRADVAYFFSSREPLELGVEGDYHFERAETNRYAQVHGAPLGRGWYARERDSDFVFLPVAEAPLVLRRSTFPDEQPASDGRRPPPRPNPFSARGRLLARADAGRYESVVAQIEAWSGQQVRWLLLAEQRPGADLSVVLTFGFLVAFAGLNGWLLVRGLSRPRPP